MHRPGWWASLGKDIDAGDRQALKPFPGLNFVILCLGRCKYKRNFQHLCALIFHFLNYFKSVEIIWQKHSLKAHSAHCVPLSCPQPRAAQHLQGMPKRTGTEQEEQLANSSLSEGYGPALVPLKINISFNFDLNGSRIQVTVNSLNHVSERVGTPQLQHQSCTSSQA